MKNIAIRVDGSSRIGMGHIMRCLTLAQEFRKREIEVTFLVKYDEKVIELLKQTRFIFQIVKESTLKQEAEIIINIINEKNLDAILIDSYWISEGYLKEIQKKIKLLISIDDNNLYTYPSNIILNANIYAKDINYKIINPNTKLLLGCDYSIIRAEFTLEPSILIKDEVKNILVTMGGCDINSYTSTILKSILDINCTINVIVGPNFICKEEIEALASTHKNIKIYNNPKNMKDIMKLNDIAISSAGTTTYELGVLGIPTILIGQADNQRNIAKKTEELGMMINLGYFNEVKEEDIKKAVLDLMENKEKRNSISKKCIKNIGRNGVKNIVEEIISYKYVEED